MKPWTPERPSATPAPAAGRPLAGGEGWLVLSDRDEGADLPALVERGVFVVELTLPLTERLMLVDHSAEDGWERGLALFHEPAAGLVLRHRQGRMVARHVLPAPLPEGQGTARLTFRFDAPARRWRMELRMLDEALSPPLVAEGTGPLPIRPADVAALSGPAEAARRHKSVLWFGLARGTALPARAPWIGLRTRVETDRGPLAAGHLRPGDRIATRDHGYLPLSGLNPLRLPACGSFAPVLLRAPYFPGREDMLVAADQSICLGGPEVEYLFGEDEVLVPAGAMVDGRTALAEQRRAIVPGVTLIFDRPTVFLADSCGLLSALPEDTSPRRRLTGHEALTLLALYGRGHHRRRA